ncbi:MAG: 3-deoxy-7-phosphoheptulonate synthase [Anaerolineae bacterium]|jgi:3-deoxy-7-phosphoheptulonate synthase
MIVVMAQAATEADVQGVVERVRELGCEAHLSQGQEATIIGVIGDQRRLRESVFEAMDGVAQVVRILKPYKLAGRGFHPRDTVVSLNGIAIGAERVVIMAGPCAAESREQLWETADAVRAQGIGVLRAGVFKPRTSPYSFQGLGREGLELLAEIRAETGMTVVTEVMAPEQVDLVAEHVDILQIGTRNMQNYNLLHAVGESGKPVLLKRGMMSTMEELLMSAEYVLSHGNEDVMLCERGIRTFERATRNTLDISAVPVLKELTHLPVLVDPSHACGNWRWVSSLALAAVAAGADGLLVEVHPQPEMALSDGEQSLRPDRFAELVQRVKAVAAAVGREV